MKQSTYIKLNRDYFNSPFWNENRPRTKAEAYIDLFQMATVNEKTYTTSDLGTTINLTRGEGVWSIRFLAQRWRWSRGKVETFLKSLKVRQKVRQYLRQGIMVSYLIDYAISQGNELYKKDTKQDRVKTGSRQGQDKYNNDNNVKNILRRGSKPEPQVKDFLQYFGEAYKNLFSFTYPCNFGKDGKIAKDLLKLYSFKVCKDLIDVAFDWAKEGGWIKDKLDIGVFKQQLPKIIIKYKQEYETEEKSGTEKITTKQ